MIWVYEGQESIRYLVSVTFVTMGKQVVPFLIGIRTNKGYSHLKQPEKSDLVEHCIDTGHKPLLASTVMMSGGATGFGDILISRQ